MPKVVDLCLSLPPSEDQIVGMMKGWARREEGGVANYGYIFGPAKAAALGLTMEKITDMSRGMSPSEFEDEIRKRAKPLVVTLGDFVDELDEAGIEWGMIESRDNDQTARIVAQYPEKFRGIALVDPHQGVQAVKELERAVKELGLRAVLASPFRSKIFQHDKRFYPIYAEAEELGIPVFCYCTMNYRTDLPMDIGRPLYLDRVAMDFPRLTIIAGWGGGGGWPWVPEMVGVARRHRNIYINTSAHRPRHLATTGSGWEVLLQFGNTLLQDRIAFASGWANYLPYSRGVVDQVVKEMESLPLEEHVREKWLYRNAIELFH